MRLPCTIVLLSAFFADSAVAQQQIPLPSQTSIQQVVPGTPSHGFWFEVPANGTAFDITGVRVPNPTSWTSQFVEIKRFTSSPPSGSGTTAFSALGQPAGGILACNVNVQPGDVICVVGECADLTFLGWVGSSSIGNPGFASTAAGNSITLNGCYTASDLATFGAGQAVTTSAFNLGRVEVYVQIALPTATTQAYGSGCGGVLHTSTLPRIGTTMNLNTTGLPAGVPLGATVLSLTQISQGIDLTPFGMPGCMQYVNVDSVYTWTPIGGVVGVTHFAIPNDQGLIGLPFATQSAVLSPGANATGALTSRGLLQTVGV